jgi:hypothetical protein
MRQRAGLDRGTRALVAAVILGGLLGGCAGRTPEAVRGLPELPPEFAKNLELARTAPVLMTRPPATAAPMTPAPMSSGGVALAPARACTAVYDGYVIYPITVCYPPSGLFGGLELQQAAAAAPAGIRAAAGPVRYFKLSSHPEVRVGRPWFCTVRGGPWYGHVEGAQICNANPNVRSFRAEILGAPEPVVVVWSGALGDVPPPLNLAAISQTGEFCVCCSGVMCPNGSCVPNPQQCTIGPPALK